MINQRNVGILPNAQQSLNPGRHVIQSNTLSNVSIKYTKQ